MFVKPPLYGILLQQVQLKTAAKDMSLPIPSSPKGIRPSYLYSSKNISLLCKLFPQVTKGKQTPKLILLSKLNSVLYFKNKIQSP